MDVEHKDTLHVRGYELAALPEVAAWVWAQTAPARVLTLEGPLGAGKTTLIRALAAQLGYTGLVQSPSFGLVHSYPTSEGPLYHMDLYRLRSEVEALDLGLEELLQSGARCLIEWPALAEPWLPPGSWRLTLQMLGPDQRQLTLEPYI